MKPWTARRALTAALHNRDVRIGETGGMRGVYALKDFAPGDLVASFHGNVMSRARLFSIQKTDRPLFDRVNEYAVWSPTKQGHLYPEDVDKLGAHLINHSCGPNAAWGPSVYDAVLVKAVKPIAAGEEITIHYLWMGFKAAFEDSRHVCRCRARFCVGTIELFVEIVKDGDRSGPWLPPKEITNRMLADIVNGTDYNTSLLLRYATNAFDMVVGAPIQPPEPIEMYERLREGAKLAVDAALRLRASGTPIDTDRLDEICARFNLPPTQRSPT